MSNTHLQHAPHILTDSAAQITAAEADAWGITVVPSSLLIGSRVLREGVDIGHAEATEHIFGSNGAHGMLIPAEAVDYMEAYRRLAPRGGILSFHPARVFGPAIERAQAAAETFRGQCDIRVIDSGTVSVGLRFLVEEARRLAASGATIDAVARDARRVAGRIYGVFASDDLSPDEVAHWPRARSIGARDTGNVPVFTLEAGELVVLERVRSMERALERIAEFTAEFEAQADLSVVQGLPRTDGAAAMLVDLLRADMPAVQDVPVAPAGALLSRSIGRRCLGVLLFDASSD